jgi:hypothetical protein
MKAKMKAKAKTMAKNERKLAIWQCENIGGIWRRKLARNVKA